MVQLLRVGLKSTPTEVAAFPFSVPAVRTLAPLDLSVPVTFFVGENGSGKSTVLEGIAAAALRLTWRKRSHRGFFLRAEDFFGFQRRLAAERAALERMTYGDLDHVGLTRDFLNNPEAFLRRLRDDGVEA